MGDFSPGTVIAGRYEVVKVQTGGMGIVCLCIDREFELPVALKTFKSEYLPNQEIRERLLREGAIWASLGYHPNIVRCYQVTQAPYDLFVFLVLELINPAEGRDDASLRSLLMPDVPLPLERALPFAMQIVRGMKHACSKISGLVHRDLKPENILVGKDGLAKVTDFGLANVFSEVSTGNSANARRIAEFLWSPLTQGIVGTPLYMAPEQWSGSTLDSRTDIYAFGCIMFEMLTGRYAVTGKDIKEIEEYHQSGRLTFPGTLQPELVSVLQRCLAREGGNRYESWAQVESALSIIYPRVLEVDAPQEEDKVAETRLEKIGRGWSFNQIGLAYRDLRKFDQAEKYVGLAFEVAKQQADKELMGASLGTFGAIFADKGDFQKALSSYRQALASATEFGDLQTIGNLLNSLGEVYRSLADLQKAKEYYEGALAIAEKIKNEIGKAVALGNLGVVAMSVGTPKEGIVLFERALATIRQTDNLAYEAHILNNLGKAYELIGEGTRGRELVEHAIRIAQQIGDRRVQQYALVNLGLMSLHSGNFAEAAGIFEQALPIAREVEDPRLEGATLQALANAYAGLGQYDKAVSHLKHAIRIYNEIGAIELSRDANDQVELIEKAISPIELQEANMVYCGQCGTANSASNNFCTRCGQSLPRQSNNDASAPLSNADKIRTLGRAVSNEEFNANFVKDAGAAGAILAEFSIETLGAFEKLKALSSQESSQVFARDASSLLRKLESFQERLKRVRDPRELEPIKAHGIAFLNEVITSTKLIMEAVLKRDSRKEKKILEHFVLRDKYWANVESAVTKYEKSRGNKLCRNCHSWVNSSDRTCKYCGRIFEIADELGYVHMGTLFLNVYASDSVNLWLNMSYEVPRVEKASLSAVCQSIIIFMDEVMVNLAREVRYDVLPYYARIVNEIDQMLPAKSFSWRDVKRDPPDTATQIAKYALSCVMTETEPMLFNTLVDVLPKHFDTASIAKFMLPHVFKWVLTYGELDPGASLLLIGLFHVFYKERWAIDDYREPGVLWVNRILHKFASQK